MRIYHNINSMTATNSLNTNESALTTSLQRLSTGLRINSAADDAAGLAISEKMRAQTAGLDQAVSNSEDGISLIQTAEGALNETQSILQRMRELSVQAANDTLTANDRQAIQEEIDQLTDEIDRISDTTTFNKKNLLDGSASAITSTDKASTKVYANGSITNEGNYKISVDLLEAGAGQVQKTNVLNTESGNQVQDVATGYAEVTTGTVATGTDDGGTMTLTLKIGDDSPVSKTFTSAGSSDRTATLLAQWINEQDEFKDLVEAYDSSGAIVLKSKEANVSLTADFATTNTNSDFSIANATSSDLVSDPAATNVSSIDVSPNSFMTGDYVVETDAGTGSTGSAKATSYSAEGNTLISTVTSDYASNQSLLMTVTSISGQNITFDYDYTEMDANGDVTEGNSKITLTANNDNNGTKIGSNTFSALHLSTSDQFTVGDKILINTQANVGSGDTISFARTPADGSAPGTNDTVKFGVTAGALNNASAEFSYYQLDEDTGTSEKTSATLSFTTLTTETEAAEFTVADGGDGNVAEASTKLKDLAQFTNASGVSLLDDPKTITLVQGDGQKATVTLYADDTLEQAAEKFNDAIANDLGQASYTGATSADSNSFAKFVGASDVTENSAYSEAGSIVFSSAVAGKDGEISFIGDEDIINALGLSEVQASQENRFSVDVTDANSGAAVASNVELTGNTLVGVVDANVDVEFDKMADSVVSWDSASKSWSVSAESTASFETTVHIAANSASFQIGANEGETMSLDLGDMSAGALGVDNILVTDQESATRSITVIDSAIEKVSTQRAKLGAYQNRLDHTITNLTTASTNLSSAESRIRDVDYADEMTEFSKNQILYQAANAMLTQANQLPQQVLSLLQ